VLFVSAVFPSLATDTGVGGGGGGEEGEGGGGEGGGKGDESARKLSHKVLSED
jgi:hypothetical protein